MNRFRSFTLCALSIFAAASLSGCGMDPFGTAAGGSRSDNYAGGIAMDTVFEAAVYDDSPAASDLIEFANTLDEDYLSRYTDSYLHRINSGQSVSSDAQENGPDIDLTAVIGRCDEIGTESGGAFDIRLGALSDLWDIDAVAKNEKEFSLPSREEVDEALNDKSIIDLGSVGKGVYLDLVYDMLKSENASGAVVSAGGSVLTYGSKPDCGNFRIGIKNPFDNGTGVHSIIEVSGDHFISTSAGYERYAGTGDDERYVHIFDPATGYPVWSREDIEGRGFEPGDDFLYPVSVTIISDSGLESDALSTACLVLGVEEGFGLAARYDAEVIFILNDGSCEMSDGLLMTEGSESIIKLAD